MIHSLYIPPRFNPMTPHFPLDDMFIVDQNILMVVNVRNMIF
jgi:hypothetical protein